ncbi:hypothetical protein, partial [Streptomyces sp. NPDC001978]|uniref:hypothetical protein n=1 Tax=Streptomyces sp. NPDC001978 TaxID=3364627 RepID=UPI0036D1F177
VEPDAPAASRDGQSRHGTGHIGQPAAHDDAVSPWKNRGQCMAAWRIIRAVAAAASVTALALAGSSTPASANATRVTRGDALAVFQAQGNGGWGVRLHGGVQEGAPSDFFPDSMARINPMRSDGRHFCSLDWHVINVLAVEGNREGESRTNTEIREALAQRVLAITLDGARLETERTAIRRTTNPANVGFVEAFAFSEGRVMAPEDLSVGPHSLQFTGQRPGGRPEVFPTITFFIDAPGQGTCV